MRRQAVSRIGCALGLMVFGAAAVSAQGRGNQAPPQLVTPAALAASFSSGTGRQRVLYGNPSQPGLYVVQLVWEPGQGSRPHFHDQARLINVLEGTWYVHTGAASDVYNPDAMTPVHAGTFIYEPANGHHYDMAKDQRVVVQIMGIGPVSTTQIPQPDAGSAPR